MGDVTDEDRVRLREDLQFARALHSLAEKEVRELRAKCAAYEEENRALASRLSSVEMAGESSESGERNICPVARPEGARAKRARDDDVREEEDCVVQCGEDGGEKVGLPNCSHFIHLDCLMLMVAIAKRARCPFCNRPLAKSGDAQEKLAALEAAEATRANSELAETLDEDDEDDDVRIVEIRHSAQEQADMNATMDSDEEDNRPINPNV